MPLHGWLRLRGHAAALFNDGLAAARAGRTGTARDRFAAVVHWHPHDTEARSALALAAFELGDVQEAARQWELVLERRPHDQLARHWLASCAATPDPDPAPGPGPGPGPDPGPGGVPRLSPAPPAV
ncbi:DUF6584 family protein [Streptomyces iconiensis]|uniref:Tetratricopeptide repeat protein n=1 Tax=Streptomyces iconiensis TaxID=1384038 RepID=A0ABT6ZZQ3_9ACTN|nr:DUF6584 family protein [Streptomyces iconiensis]MDJ1134557.1 tetratricopeptide repeat protein [Streptomyces iconiensis]